MRKEQGNDITKMNKEEILAHMNWYGFKDGKYHPLSSSKEFLHLVNAYIALRDARVQSESAFSYEFLKQERKKNLITFLYNILANHRQLCATQEVMLKRIAKLWMLVRVLCIGCTIALAVICALLWKIYGA